MTEAPVLPRIRMAVIRGGFFDGAWHVPGDRIEVDASVVELLQQAGYVVPADDPPAPPKRGARKDPTP